MDKKAPTTEENLETVVGEVLSNEEVAEKKKSLVRRDKNNYAFGSFITKSNDLIQKTKYSLPRNEQKILFMLLSKIDQRHDTDASKYYTISFSEFSQLTGVNALDSSYMKYLQDTVNSLASRFFWVPSSDGNGYDQMSWILPTTEVNIKDKTIKMQFHPKIWKDIAQLTSNYTSYSIEYLLMMQSTYTMRVYEILLSYDNGNRDYGYNNGLVFEPVTDKIANKFPDKELKGYKYKRFDTDEFKAMLSVPPANEQNSKKKKDEKDTSKYSREKTLAEKYPTFSLFEKNVLLTVKKEINELTDLWFDYAAVRERRERKYRYLYIFIKYKTKEEMKDVRAFHDNHKVDTEISKKPRKRKKNAQADAEIKNNLRDDALLPFFEDVINYKYRKLATLIKTKAEYSAYEDKLSVDDKNVINDICTYTSKILTSETRREQAEDALESLNRIIQDNNGLKTWMLGMCVKMTKLLHESTAKKSAQYYRTVVYNDIVEGSASIIAAGQEKLRSLENKDVFKANFMDFSD